MKILSYSYLHSNWALSIGYWVLVIGHSSIFRIWFYRLKRVVAWQG
ncbi:hypothetical protein [Nostoc sp.]